MEMINKNLVSLNNFASSARNNNKTYPFKNNELKRQI